MKFKLDENIGRRGLEYLEASGHDVMSVRDQDLGGVADEELFAACSAEGRVLITLDRDFGHVPRFPPEKSARDHHLGCWTESYATEERMRLAAPVPGTHVTKA